MKFIVRKNGTSVIVNKAVVQIPGGEYETKDKDLCGVLLKCKGVNEVKDK